MAKATFNSCLGGFVFEAILLALFSSFRVSRKIVGDPIGRIGSFDANA